MAFHLPVMLQEVLEGLAPRPGGIALDCTAGGGGHSEALARAVGPDGTLILFDRDPVALEVASDRVRGLCLKVQAMRGSFRSASLLLDSIGVANVDCALMDLGVSSYQLDTAERGFSFRADAPLDMRLDPSAEMTAWEVVNRWSEPELDRILRELGEERHHRRIARAIAGARLSGPIETTLQLAEIVKRAVPGKASKDGIHPATLTFMAIRIAVNEELVALKEGLEQVADRLEVGGRIAILSYHSLEDRIVKHSLLKMTGRCTCPPSLPECRCSPVRTLKILTKKPLLPTPSEIAANPRARSAKLRIAERV